MGTLLSGCSRDRGFLSVPFPSCPNSRTYVLTLSKFGGEKEMGTKEERFASCDLLEQASLWRNPTARHLISGCEWTKSSHKALCSGAPSDLSFVRQCTCVTLMKLINLAEASGNREE